MNENNELVKLVVAVLRGMNANAETMQHIINEIGIEDEMRHQLNGGESVLTRLDNLAADDLIGEITDEITDQGEDLIEDYDIAIYDRTLEITDIKIDDSEIRRCVKRIVEKHFEIV
jgi:hypothetical protein